MSQFLVSDTQLSAIVSAACWFGLSFDGEAVVNRTAQRVTDALRAENLESLRRYYGRDHEVSRDPGPAVFTWQAPTQPIAVFKLIDCYLYQIGDYPGYDASPAIRLCYALQRAIADRFQVAVEAVHDFALYAASPWAIEDAPQADGRAVAA